MIAPLSPFCMSDVLALFGASIVMRAPCSMRPGGAGHDVFPRVTTDAARLAKSLAGDYDWRRLDGSGLDCFLSAGQMGLMSERCHAVARAASEEAIEAWVEVDRPVVESRLASLRLDTGHPCDRPAALRSISTPQPRSAHIGRSLLALVALAHEDGVLSRLIPQCDEVTVLPQDRDLKHAHLGDSLAARAALTACLWVWPCPLEPVLAADLIADLATGALRDRVPIVWLEARKTLRGRAWGPGTATWHTFRDATVWQAPRLTRRIGVNGPRWRGDCAEVVVTRGRDVLDAILVQDGRDRAAIAAARRKLAGYHWLTDASD